MQCGKLNLFQMEAHCGYREWYRLWLLGDHCDAALVLESGQTFSSCGTTCRWFKDIIMLSNPFYEYLRGRPFFVWFLFSPFPANFLTLTNNVNRASDDFRCARPFTTVSVNKKKYWSSCTQIEPFGGPYRNYLSTIDCIGSTNEHLEDPS